MSVKWRLETNLKERRRDRGKVRGPHRPVRSVVQRAFDLQAMMAANGWMQSQLADHLDISRAAVSQALRVCRLDARVRAAMREKAEGGWRARQADVRRFARLPVAQVLEELLVT